jgi:hypothetical protein
MALSGHFRQADACPLLGAKQTFPSTAQLDIIVIAVRLLIAGHNNRYPWAALTAARDGNEPGVGEDFERSALGAALNTPAIQVKIGN